VETNPQTDETQSEQHDALTSKGPDLAPGGSHDSTEHSAPVRVNTATIYHDQDRITTVRFQNIFGYVTLITFMLMVVSVISRGEHLGLVCIAPFVAVAIGFFAALTVTCLLSRKRSDSEEESGAFEISRRFQKAGAPWKAPIDSRFGDPLNPGDERVEGSDTTRKLDMPSEQIRANLPPNGEDSTEIF
jgi:hypothetical protein